MFLAVASSDPDRMQEWLVRWSERPGLRRARARAFDAAFGCAIEEDGRSECVHGEASVVLGTMRVEPIDSGRARPLVPSDVTPLHVVREMLQEGALSALRLFKGPFALVFWNRRTRELLAVRDPLGLAPLYYLEHPDGLVFSNSLDAFEDEARFDLDYIAQFIASRGTPGTAATIRRGVRAVPPGTWLRWIDGRLTSDRYWSISDLSPLRIPLRDAAIEFRSLLYGAVAAHMDPGSRTWGHLSGGLDSSSVASAAAAMAQDGREAPTLGGTLTLRDSLGGSDETDFAGEVVRRYNLPNTIVSDCWPWQLDDVGPPMTDRPSRDYPWYARDRAMARIVTRHGGTALLSGFGPDIYLPFTAAHCPDLLWSGRLAAAARELHASAAARKQTFWRAAFGDGLLPLLSRRRMALSNERPRRILGWFTPEFRERHLLAERLAASSRYAGPRGHYYDHEVADRLDAAAARISHWMYAPGLDLRHPLMHLPLVEFCVRLPFELRTNLHWTKPLLRTAMKGVLPDKVRLREDKRTSSACLHWALRHEREQLHRLLAQPVLAELGCIEPREIRQALDSFEPYGSGEASFLYAVLSLETWLSAKSGRWTLGDRTFGGKGASHGGRLAPRGDPFEPRQSAGSIGK